ncbi:MAG TPA: hypothetical protein VH684_16555 [Xanthobacteraceae bacterium]|jgi:hypothetical protein
MVDMPPAVELMTVTIPQGAPSIAAAAKQLGVKPEDIDAAYGVVPVDPGRGLYAVQVRADRLPRQPQSGREGYQGPWSNPRIEPFGPIQEGTPKDKNSR